MTSFYQKTHQKKHPKMRVNVSFTRMATLCLFVFVGLFNTSTVFADSVKFTVKSFTLAQGTFVQKKYFKVLKQPIISSGDFFFEQNVGFLWQTQKPVYAAIMLKNNQLYNVISVQQKEKIVGGADIATILVSAISGDIDALQTSFDIKQGDQRQCLLLQPKNENLNQVFKIIKLCTKSVVGADTALVVPQVIEKIILQEHSGNRTEILLTIDDTAELPEDIRAQLQ